MNDGAPTLYVGAREWVGDARKHPQPVGVETRSRFDDEEVRRMTHQAVGRAGAMNRDLRPGKTEAEIAHELTYTKSGGFAERVIGVVLLVCGILSILRPSGSSSFLPKKR